MKRIQLEYFTNNQIKYLCDHYRIMGDCELAEVFQEKWPKRKGWTKKHIEKKRNYLGLNRTTQEIRAIHQRNVNTGRFSLCPVKAWDKRDAAQKEKLGIGRIKKLVRNILLLNQRELSTLV